MEWQKYAVTAGVSMGVVGYLMSGILYFTSGIVVPFGVVPLMWAIWMAGVWGVVQVARMRSLWVLASGPAAVLLWYLIVSLGGWLFGWTA
jgi:hypothetical protein